MIFHFLKRCFSKNSFFSFDRRKLPLCAFLRNDQRTNQPKMEAENPNSALVWVDCEMTGLNYFEDSVLEIGVILTDGQLNEIDSLPPMVIQTDEEILNGMNDWCKEQHGKSGLTKACLESNLTIDMADDILYEFLNKRNIDEGILAGNSIAVDRIFLEKWCPKFCSLLHYRLMDVSSVHELIKRWYPLEPKVEEERPHRALEDTRASIDQLRRYRSKYFVDPSQVTPK